MKDYMFIFRADYNNMPARTYEEMQTLGKKWGEWKNAAIAQNKFIEDGKGLAFTGKVVKDNDVVTNGPYTELKELLGGYCLIRAESYDDAVELAKDCPQLDMGGSVEIREINPLT